MSSPTPSERPRDFEGKVAIVTGGASGIARATARLLAEQGASVAVFDLNEQAGAEVAAGLNQAGATASFHRCDVTSRTEVERAIGAVLDRYDHIDVLANVVGGSDAEGGPQPAWVYEMEESEWDAMIAMNLKSTFLCCRFVLPHMMSRRGGTIVNTSSGRAVIPAPQRAHYSAAKAGVIALTLTLSIEAAPYGIRVNSVAPGATHTPRIRRGFTDEQWTAFLAKQPLGRIAEPEDTAEAIVFLAGPHSRHINGQVLHVNGGAPN
ncbi:MAG TPA: SDR family NAD(P)-dependent oxidoreductase [Chloroflexota bacterium]|nr:SDR family NAD(P)-dependent oxidoreductase [Chloroflexota bacterium]